MQIVINISKEAYEHIKDKRRFFRQVEIDDCNGYPYFGAILDGVVLPKGHGRLCDMDEALKCIEETADCKIKQYAIGMLDWAMSKRTIIEADKDGE